MTKEQLEQWAKTPMVSRVATDKYCVEVDEKGRKWKLEKLGPTTFRLVAQIDQVPVA